MPAICRSRATVTILTPPLQHPTRTERTCSTLDTALSHAGRTVPCCRCLSAHSARLLPRATSAAAIATPLFWLPLPSTLGLRPHLFRQVARHTGLAYCGPTQLHSHLPCARPTSRRPLGRRTYTPLPLRLSTTTISRPSALFPLRQHAAAVTRRTDSPPSTAPPPAPHRRVTTGGLLPLLPRQLPNSPSSSGARYRGCSTYMRTSNSSRGQLRCFTLCSTWGGREGTDRTCARQRPAAAAAAPGGQGNGEGRDGNASHPALYDTTRHAYGSC